MTGCCEYISSSKRGLTKEIEILVPWGIIAGKVLGDSTNPPVLCIHGWLDNCNTFDNLIPMLPKDNFFVFIDLPGHGLSSHLPPGMFYSKDHYVFVVDQIANYFSWATFNLLGHSLGGIISVFYAGTFPEKVDKTICLDGVVYVNEYIDGLDKPDVQWLKGRIQYYNTLNKKKPKKTTYDKLRQRLLDRNFGLKSVEIADALLERGCKKMEDGYVFRHDIRQSTNSFIDVSYNTGLQFVSNIKAESLVIHGHDGVMQRSVPKELRSFVSSSLEQSFRHSEFYQGVVVQGGHYLHLDAPERIISLLTSFLNRPIRSGLRLELPISKL
ncbi:serine hydrolase-like protein [Clavelina lepadiformis]|uniref:serine hydrolase-like protein n=1 Tax=Clavelina lepadiformis TaxID=159417 RepID=UPI0040437C10